VAKLLTHVDDKNNPTMVDVSEKSMAERTAIARGFIRLPEEVLSLVSEKDIHGKKGPVLATARIAGTMAVKKTHELIPFCHPIPIDSIKFKMELSDQGCEILCIVKTNYKTGVEMEALTGVQVAALTIYDMCKAVTQNMVIEESRLIKKTGGKKDYDYGN
jgi:cyclic pyranopterin phosphate synthase